MRGREITRITDYKTNEKSLLSSAKVIEREAEEKREARPAPRQMAPVAVTAGAPPVTYLSPERYGLK